MSNMQGWGPPRREPSRLVRRNRLIVKWVLIGVLLVVAYAIAWELSQLADAATGVS